MITFFAIHVLFTHLHSTQFPVPVFSQIIPSNQPMIYVELPLIPLIKPRHYMFHSSRRSSTCNAMCRNVPFLKIRVFSFRIMDVQYLLRISSNSDG
jgi:hypothetical protein